ncbi:hypothetical protein [Clostridium grantii]|uniref:Uncharacterized protein n=1 Tax=Clostridium grantii DSM 8605 TaxID=1121316 RepID=A0A1M5WYD2_9CLOT|nr:hypothetical protein [Clostridium grantii]SHH92362.1 hypothetical protein SAMN02745207_03204 [Clostridium grantii DSM 8605]
MSAYILKDATYIEKINEGKRITASFANAHKVSYYMADDNKAAPHILRNKDRTVRTFPQIITYCYDKFNKSEKLLEYIKLIIKNI